MIPYARQDISEADIDAVIEVLRSDWLTQGPVVERFERAVAEYCGAEYAVAVNSATSALHLSCLALGLGPGDTLWTSPISFVASANCALYCGANVDFVDIDPRTVNMSVEALVAKLENAERDGRLPSIVMPVHFAGQSCAMREIRALGERYGFRILEDASHAIGGRYLDEPVGSCRYSDVAVFSFHPVKIITTGEGGMLITNDAELAARARLLRSHGITRDETKMQGPSHGPWYYQQIALGYNYRMTDFQAALGLSQLTRVDEFVAKRRRLAGAYDAAFSDLPLEPIDRNPDAQSSWHLYVLRWNRAGVARSQRDLFESLTGSGVKVNLHYIPIHMQPYYSAMGFTVGAFPNAEDYYASAMSLPMYCGLTDSLQAKVIASIAAACR